FKQTGLIEGKSWLEAAKDHFQLIAHARELVAAIDAGPDYITTLPLSFDASNSGAQHYAMLARDPDGARLTNLTFAGSPQCFYTEIGRTLDRDFAAILAEGRQTRSGAFTTGSASVPPTASS